MNPLPALLAAILVSSSAATAESRIFDAAEFGAVGDGIHDDGPAVLKMIDAAKPSGQPATLRFSPGKNYHLKTGHERYAFPLDGASDLTVDGGGSLFTVDSGIRFMRAVGAKRLVVSDLQVDYSPLPFADGLIVAKDAAAGTIDVQVDGSFALPPAGGPTKQDGEQAFFAVLWHPGAYSEAGSPYFTRHHFFLREIIDMGADRIVRLVSSDEKIANLIRSIQLNEWRCSIPVRGIAHCFGPGPNILVEQCTDVAFTRVDVWSAPWFAFTVIDNDGAIVFKNVNIRPKPGTRRMTSSWRDGFHIKNNTASLLWDGCTLQGMNDDAFNISCHTSRIRKILTPTRIEISQNYPLGIARMRPGDTLRFYHTSRGVDPGSARIVKANYSKPVFTLELDQAIPGLEAGKTLVWNESTANPKSVIRNCRVDVSSRFRSGVTIENSDFRAFCWFTGDEIETPLPSRVVVRNSSFRCGQGNPTLAISIGGPHFDGRGPTEPVMRDYLFENNRIAGDFRLADVRNARLEDNNFTDTKRSISFHNAADIRLRGNTRGGQPLNSPDGINAGNPAPEIRFEK
jgi:hypothetical protein